MVQKSYFALVRSEYTFISSILWYLPERLAIFATCFPQSINEISRHFPTTNWRFSRFFSHCWQHGEFPDLSPRIIAEIRRVLFFYLTAGRIFIFFHFQFSFLDRMTKFTIYYFSCDWLTIFGIFFLSKNSRILHYFSGPISKSCRFILWLIDEIHYFFPTLNWKFNDFFPWWIN